MKTRQKDGDFVAPTLYSPDGNILVATQATFKKTNAQKIAHKLLNDPVKLYTLLYGGSRSGKTAIIIRNILVRALKYPNSRHLFLRLHFSHAKTALWHDTVPKILRLCFPELKEDVHYFRNKQDWFIQFWNGSQLWFGGLDEKERVEKILGTEYATIYFNECNQFSYDGVTTAITRLAQVIPGCRKKLYFDCNPPNKRHWVYTLFVKGINPSTGRAVDKPGVYAIHRMNPDDNKENIGQDYIDDILNSLDERKIKRFRDGEFLDDAEGALFKYTNLIRDRIPKEKMDMNVIDKIVISVDPAVTANETSDYHGICAVGHCKETDDLYIFEDASCQGSPKKWANLVKQVYDQHEANTVIGEVNNGGDLVEVNIRTVSRTMPFEMVRASKGKAIRAEPVASMSERGKLHLVGEFPELEEELTSWIPDIGMKSPNRMDAMIWGCSYFLRPKKRAGLW